MGWADPTKHLGALETRRLLGGGAPVLTQQLWGGGPLDPMTLRGFLPARDPSGMGGQPSGCH